MVTPVSTANSVARPCRPPGPRHDDAQRHGERDQAEAQQQDAGDVLRPQVLADEAARHQRHQQRPQPARDRIGVAQIAVGIGLQQERVVERRGSAPRSRGISTPPARSAAGTARRLSPITRAGGHDHAEGREPVRPVGLQHARSTTRASGLPPAAARRPGVRRPFSRLSAPRGCRAGAEGSGRCNFYLFLCATKTQRARFAGTGSAGLAVGGAYLAVAAGVDHLVDEFGVARQDAPVDRTGGGGDLAVAAQ